MKLVFASFAIAFVLITAVEISLYGGAGYAPFAQPGIAAGHPADTMRGSEAYYRWLRNCLGGIRKDIPRITASAETAAARFVSDDYEIGAWGDAAFVSEFTGRAGGLMPVNNPSGPTDGGSKRIVLFCLREERLQEDLVQAAEFRKQGNIVIVFARKSILDSARKSGAQFDAAVENHAAENGGLFRGKDGSWVVPTDPPANLTALWVWTGEFVGACTRLGKLPPIWQSFSVSGAQERDSRYAGVKFHEETPVPVKPGRIGREYLKELERLLEAIYSSDKENLKAAGVLALRSHDQGRKFYAYLFGHALDVLMSVPHDPGYFTQTAKPWSNQTDGMEIRCGDYVLAVGYDRKCWGKQFDLFAEKVRNIGADVVWSTTTYSPEEFDAIPNIGIFINQRWALGDALVTLSNYDTRILPASGVIGESIFWMINANIHTGLNAR